MLLRLVDDEFLEAGAGGLAGEVHLVCLAGRVDRVGAFSVVLRDLVLCLPGLLSSRVGHGAAVALLLVYV